MNIIIVCFIIHIILIALLLLLRVLNVLKCDYILILIAFFVPLWGVLMLINKEIADRRKNRKKYEIEVTRMKTDVVMRSIEVSREQDDVVPINEALLINDNDYQRELFRDILYNVDSSIVIDNDDVVEKVVPLGEAMVLNDAETKRELIMDVLYSNPSDYIYQLTEAKKNDDTEVVHYAVTALVELQKEFDTKFQELTKKMELDPDNESLERDYLKLQERYITCGLLDGDGLRTQQENYRSNLKKSIEKGNASWTVQSRLADIDIKLMDDNALAGDILEMMKKWPDNDSIYYYRFQLAILRKDSKEIKKLIDEIHRKDVYVSNNLRELIQFWSDKNE